MTTEDFQDRVVLVTGGTSGIGLAAARAFAQRNAKVVVAARGVERGEQAAHELTSEGGRAIFVCADMVEPEDIRRMVRTTGSALWSARLRVQQRGGRGGALALTADFTEEQFDHTIRVNLKGVWLCMKHEIQQMLAQNPSGGVIVNASSVNGLGGAPRGALYSASKAGVIALTKSALQEYAKLGVRVNALAAGAIRTPRVERMFDGASGGSAGARKALQEKYEERIAMGRIGSPEEAAEAVVWLASSGASYVTGHSMIVDGGMTAAVR